METLEFKTNPVRERFDNDTLGFAINLKEAARIGYGASVEFVRSNDLKVFRFASLEDARKEFEKMKGWDKSDVIDLLGHNPYLK